MRLHGRAPNLFMLHLSPRPSRVIETRHLHGFKIQVLDNGAPKFKYEWVLTPLKPGLRRICRTSKVYDPTSHRSKKMCLDQAKYEVNLLRMPKLGYWCER